MLAGDLNIPRESFLTVLRDIVVGGRLKLDPSRNDFPVTLHDPCNMVRLMGIVEPQRRDPAADLPAVPRDDAARRGQLLLRRRQRVRHHERQQLRATGARRCPGARSSSRSSTPSRTCLDPSIPKYVCAPCSNCKGQIRDMLAYHDIWEQHRILYGGLVELIVNAMTDVKPGFIEWEFH